jgi:hypothetical protein
MIKYAVIRRTLKNIRERAQSLHMLEKSNVDEHTAVPRVHWHGGYRVHEEVNQGRTNEVLIDIGMTTAGWWSFVGDEGFAQH